MREHVGNYKSLFVWWIVTLLLATAAYWIGYQGLYQIIFKADITHISQLVAIFIVIGNFRIGWFAWMWGHQNDYSYGDTAKFVARVRKHLDEWWFVSETSMGFGILGTVCGFIYLIYSAFGDLAGGVTPDVVSHLLPKIVSPMGTIFFTTAAGVTGALILKIQLFLFTSVSGIDDDNYET